MNRITSLTILLTLSFSGNSIAADNWAKNLFKVTSHDFGTVAKDSNAVFAFEFENPFAVDIHVSGVRTSCGCTTPTISKETLTTYEKAQIIAKYNTDRFVGQRGATLTVTFDKPNYAEVQLTVKGYIRSDIILDPGGFEFGSIDQGASAERSIRVSYRGGKGDWQIVGVNNENEFFDVEVKPIENNRREFDFVAKLHEDAPIGYFTKQVVLRTNDSRALEIPVKVEGQVQAPLTVSPASLYLGVVAPGAKIEQKLIVRGKQPFKIIAIKPDDGRYEFRISDSAKKIHVIPFTYTGSKPGKYVDTIEVVTDLGDGVTARCQALSAVIEAGVASN